MITVITCTGNRPEAYKLCEMYLLRQIYKEKIQWIVVVDDPEADTRGATLELSDSITRELYLGPLLWREGINTQRYNLAEAIKHIEGEYVFFMEDDDWYAADYIELMMDALFHRPLAGEGNSRYYNIHYKCYKELGNLNHCSLSQTAFHKSLIPIFEEAVHSGEFYIDVQFWKKVIAKKIKRTVMADSDISIGIKGMPGRKGLGIGHTPVGYVSDPAYTQLKIWLKEDYKYYEKFLTESKHSGNLTK